MNRDFLKTVLSAKRNKIEMSEERHIHMAIPQGITKYALYPSAHFNGKLISDKELKTIFHYVDKVVDLLLHCTESVGNLPKIQKYEPSSGDISMEIEIKPVPVGDVHNAYLGVDDAGSPWGKEGVQDYIQGVGLYRSRYAGGYFEDKVQFTVYHPAGTYSAGWGYTNGISPYIVGSLQIMTGEQAKQLYQNVKRAVSKVYDPNYSLLEAWSKEIGKPLKNVSLYG